MVALLGCMKELGDLAVEKDKRFKQSYIINKDKIGTKSIKLNFNNETEWTHALKYMLTNLKFLLMWCSQSQK